jgi:hypothetical protein
MPRLQRDSTENDHSKGEVMKDWSYKVYNNKYHTTERHIDCDSKEQAVSEAVEWLDRKFRDLPYEEIEEFREALTEIGLAEVDIYFVSVDAPEEEMEFSTGTLKK